jgi:hypothetical protein
MKAENKLGRDRGFKHGKRRTSKDDPTKAALVNALLLDRINLNARSPKEGPSAPGSPARTLPPVKVPGRVTGSSQPG